MPEGTLRLPHLWNTVRTLPQVVDVDYIIPGCPPQPDQIATVVDAVIDILSEGQAPSAQGHRARRRRPRLLRRVPAHSGTSKKIKQFVRPHEIVPDPDICLLEQGMVCMGPATTGRVRRQVLGGRRAVPGLLRSARRRPRPGREDGVGASPASSTRPTRRRSTESSTPIPDMMGTFYRFSLPQSTLRRRQP